MNSLSPIPASFAFSLKKVPAEWYGTPSLLASSVEVAVLPTPESPLMVTTTTPSPPDIHEVLGLPIVGEKAEVRVVPVEEPQAGKGGVHGPEVPEEGRLSVINHY